MNADYAARARSMLNVPFLHQGRTRNGVDCIGLLAYAFDYSVDKLPTYPRDPYNGQLEHALDAVLGAPLAVYGAHGAPLAALVPGYVLALAYARSTRHVALVLEHPAYTGVLSIIHTDSTLGRVTEHILDGKWLRRIRRVYAP